MAEAHVPVASDAEHRCHVTVLRPGNRLRELRMRAGWTQQDLSQSSGECVKVIDELENCRGRFTVEWMRVFSRTLGCAPSDFLSDEDHPSRLTPDDRQSISRYRAATPAQRRLLDRFAAGAPLPANLP